METRDRATGPASLILALSPSRAVGLHVLERTHAKTCFAQDVPRKCEVASAVATIPGSPRPLVAILLEQVRAVLHEGHLQRVVGEPGATDAAAELRGRHGRDDHIEGRRRQSVLASAAAAIDAVKRSGYGRHLAMRRAQPRGRRQTMGSPIAEALMSTPAGEPWRHTKCSPRPRQPNTHSKTHTKMQEGAQLYHAPYEPRPSCNLVSCARATAAPNSWTGHKRSPSPRSCKELLRQTPRKYTTCATHVRSMRADASDAPRAPRAPSCYPCSS